MNTSPPLGKLTALLMVAASVAACADSPTAPDFDPQFLIGNSPLSPITLDTSGKRPTLRTSVTLSKGTASVPTAGKWLLRSSGEVQRPDGRTLAGLGSSDAGLSEQEAAMIQDGSAVGFIMDIDIPAPTWDRIKDLDEIYAHLRAELIFVSEAGDEKILDAVGVTGAFSPRG